MKRKKIKYVDEWDLDKKALRVVKRELSNWIDVFMSRADNPRVQVEMCDFKENELFFFTTCHDILKDDPEEAGIENNVDIRRRKRQIMHALFLRQLIGKNINHWNRKCSHCGNNNMIIEHLGNESYHRHCPDCNRFVIDTYGKDFHTMFDDLFKKYIEVKDEEKK